MKTGIFLFLSVFGCHCYGAVNVGVLVPFHSPRGVRLGQERDLLAASALLAATHIRDGNFSLLPFSIGSPIVQNVTLSFKDTYSDPAVAVRRVLEWQDSRAVHAIVGPSFSSVAIPVSIVASSYALPVLSYGATSTVLSKGTRHSFFSRLVSSDSMLAAAVLQAIKSLAWKNIAILYVDDDYGVSMLQALQAQAAEHQVSTVATIPFDHDDPEHIADAVEALVTSSAKIFICVAYSSDIQHIIVKADTAGLFSSSYAWLNANPAVDLAEIALELDHEPTSRVLSGWIGIARASGSPTFSHAVEHSLRHEVDGWQHGPVDSSRVSNCLQCAYAYDAVWMIALAAGKLLEAEGHAGNLTGADLHPAIRTVEFIGASGNVSLDPATGDPRAEDKVFRMVNWVLQSDGAGDPRLERRTVALVDVLSGVFDKDEAGPVWLGGSQGWAAAPLDGRSCQLGAVFSAAVGRCVLCQPGSFANASALACQACPVGTAAPESGMAQCIRCKQGFADRPGLEECLPCPDNSIRRGDSLGLSRGDCVCVAGYPPPCSSARVRAPRTPNTDPALMRVAGSRFYAKDGDCVPCPPGGSCPGASETPFPLQGYWADVSCVQLGGSEACEAWDTFQQCVPLTDCDGGALFECDAQGALTGRLCKRVKAGWFRVGGWSFQCGQGGWLWSLVAIACTMLAWFAINWVASGSYDAMDICLLYVQVTGIVSSFGLRWHENLGTLNMLLGIANFDTDFATPHCLMGWGPVESFFLQLAMPVIWPCGIVLSAACGAMYRWQVRREAFSMRRTVAQVTRRVTKETTSMLIVVYHTICLRCFSVFSCTRFPNGRSYLSSAPEVECLSGPHRWMIAVTALYIPVFVLGLPLALVWLVRKGEAEARLNHVDFHATWGHLYARYDPGWKWWEAVLLLRRLALALIYACVSPPMLQSALAVAVLAGLLTAHAYARPYSSNAIDMLEVFTLWGSTLYALFGMLFYPSISPSSQGYVCPDHAHACAEDNRIKDGISLVLLGWTIATLLLAVWVSIVDIRETSMSKTASKILRGIKGSPMSMSVSVSRMFSSSVPSQMRRISHGSMFIGRVSTSPDSLSSDGGSTCSNTSLRIVTGVLSLDSLQAPGKTMAVALDQLLRGAPLLAWVRNTRASAELEGPAKAFQEVHRELAALSDDVGTNAVSCRAEAFRCLDSFPGMVDFLVTHASDAHCQHLAEVLHAYSEFLEGARRKFPVTALVNADFRAVLLHSLIVAGPAHRSNFALICREIDGSAGRDAAPDKRGQLSGMEEGSAPQTLPCTHRGPSRHLRPPSLRPALRSLRNLAAFLGTPTRSQLIGLDSLPASRGAGTGRDEPAAGASSSTSAGGQSGETSAAALESERVDSDDQPPEATKAADWVCESEVASCRQLQADQDWIQGAPSGTASRPRAPTAWTPCASAESGSGRLGPASCKSLSSDPEGHQRPSQADGSSDESHWLQTANSLQRMPA